MRTVNATEFKRNMGSYMTQASAEPVAIEKYGRPQLVVLSHEEYQRLVQLEDRSWLELAQAARAEGFASPEETEAMLRRFRETPAGEAE